jgi:hypothetical protein
MKISDTFQKEIENLDKEIFKMEQLGLQDDRYYSILQMERAVKISEMQYCVENNL